jgi:hypothetical protein
MLNNLVIQMVKKNKKWRVGQPTRQLANKWAGMSFEPKYLSCPARARPTFRRA